MGFLVFADGPGLSGGAAGVFLCAQKYGVQGRRWYRELYPKARGRADVGFWKRERNEHNFLCVHKSDPGHGRP